MAATLALRSKDGHLRCLLSMEMVRALIRRYMGEWKDNQKGESCYYFRESATYGNHDIAVAIFPGDYVNVEDRR